MANVAGLMAISDFPKAPEMAGHLAALVDHLVLRFDALNGDKEIFKAAVDEATRVTHTHGIRSRERWNRWNWREQLLRSLDSVKPDLVLFLDSDERFGPGIEDTLHRFRASGRDMCLFDYEMVTSDGREVGKYPKSRHCKAFRWVPRLGYRPYRGYARPTFPGYGSRGDATVFYADSVVEHFCFYTPEMEMEKRKNLHK